MLVTSEVKVRHSRRDVIDILARLRHRFLERTVARVLIPTLWQIGRTANKMCAFGQTKADERCKRSNDFRCPERARISWGRAMRVGGPGEGPNLIALGALHRLSLIHISEPTRP